MKFNDLNQVKSTQFNKDELLVSRIYNFAADKALEAEHEFGITSKEGDLVYNSIITSLLYLKDYPKES